jgi:hypothetical protein
LQARRKELFGAKFEALLYEPTSTYFRLSACGEDLFTAAKAIMLLGGLQRFLRCVSARHA